MPEITSRLSAALADRYNVERRLGEGGMATVYLAHDLKHDRKVALKVLRPELAALLGAERFVQEIKTTAQLQHPHILPLFDSGTTGQQDGGTAFLYYVMPFIEGETLRDKLNRETQLSIDEAIKITTEVADALGYAHRQGVIHRDVKPENILLHDGRPMVADFGIALAVSAAAGGRMTETGMSLGTPHYMSPEQATAEKELSARSDVYSLGSVLYEMLTGEPPHTGGSAQQIIMKIVTDTPRPVTELRRSVPPNVAAALAQSLAKLPADRFGTAVEFASALTDPSFPGRVGLPAAAVPAKLWNWLSTVLAAASVLLAFALVQSLTAHRSSPPVATRFTIPVSGGIDVGFWGATTFALSPDGRTLVYSTGGLLHQRSLGAFEDEPIPGTEGAVAPFFSPDGEWIGFTQYPAMKKVPVQGGPAVPIVDREAQLGASWGSDGIIVYAEALGTAGLWRVSASGGPPTRLTAVVDSTSETQHVWPQVLGGGEAVLFTIVGPSNSWTDAHIVIHDLASGRRDTVASQATIGRYIPTGHILYMNSERTVLALPYDLGSRRATGSAFPLLDSVPVNPTAGRALFEVSDAGTVAFLHGTGAAWNVLKWVDRDGRTLGEVGPPLHGNYFRLSPNGRRIGIGLRRPADINVWLLDVEDGRGEPFTFDPAEEETPVWSPDGMRIAYKAAWVGQASRVYVKPVDRGEEPRLLLNRPGHLHLTDWSHDGNWIVGHEVHPDSSTDIWALNPVDSSAHILVAGTGYAESDAVFSPDGRWLAYVSDEPGLAEVYVVSFPALGRKRQVSNGGGRFPRWSSAGRELFFLRGDTLVAAPISSAGEDLDVGTPTRVFEMPHLYEYDVAADGRFLVRTVNEDGLQREIYVIENLSAELGPRRRQ